MRSLFIEKHGAFDELRYGDAPEPRPGYAEVVVRLRTAALNHLDLFVLGGMPGITISLPHIGGADGAGVVVGVGEGVPGWSVGDEVVLNPGLSCGACEYCAKGEESQCVSYRLLGEHVDGTFAELVKVPAVNLAAKPTHLTWDEAAALPLTFLTAWRMLISRARLSQGETVLIHGIGGGVALAALAIAKRAGATVFVTSSSDTKLTRARELGADATINHASTDVAKEVRSLTGKRGVDVVVETVGSATWLTSLRCAAKGGRIVTCGATSGPNPSEEIRLIFWNHLSVLGSTMGSRGDWLAMLRAVNAGKMRPLVDSTYPLHRGREAYQRLSAGAQFGKIVLGVDEAAIAAAEV